MSHFLWMHQSACKSTQIFKIFWVGMSPDKLESSAEGATEAR